MKPAILLTAILLSACTAQQISDAEAIGQKIPGAVAAACADAQKAANTAAGVLKGGALNTANSIISYVTAGCGAATQVAALAADPSSLQWLGQLTGTLSAMATPPATTVPPAN